MANNSHRQMKEEEGRRITAVDAFNVADKRIQELTTKLNEANRAKKSIEAALQGVKRQAKSQCKQLCQTEDQLSAAKKQIGVLKKKLKEAKKAKGQAEKAKDQAEQDGYEIEVVKTEKALKAEVLGVCRTYCLQVWNEALDQAKVEAFSALRKAKNVYYPLVIHASGLSSSSSPKADIVPKETNVDKDSLAKVLPSSTSPPKEAEQAKAPKKGKDTTKRVVPKATKPLAMPKDPSKGKEASQSLEIVLATLPILAKEDPKGKCPASSTAKNAKSTKATGKENPPLKIN